MIELIYLLLILCLVSYFFIKDKSKIKTVKDFFWGMTCKSISFVLFVIILTCILKVYLPQEYITQYLGKENGIYAPIIAAFFASLIEGPIIIGFVIGFSLLSQGASVAATISFVSSFSMVGLLAIPLEKEQLGKTFAFVRYGFTFVFSIIIGYLCDFLYSYTM